MAVISYFIHCPFYKHQVVVSCLGYYFSTVSNRDIDPVRVHKMYTRSYCLCIKVGCTYFWHLTVSIPCKRYLWQFIKYGERLFYSWEMFAELKINIFFKNAIRYFVSIFKKWLPHSITTTLIVVLQLP